MSLSALAARTHFSKAQLGHLETGRRSVRPEHVKAYEDALGVPVRLRAESVSVTDLELVRQAVGIVTATGLRDGGTTTVGVASAHWEWARGLLDRSVPSHLATSLRTTSARLADRFAWSLAESGRYGKARSLYATALGLAGDDQVVRAAVVVNLANHHTATGRPEEGLALLASVGSVTPVVEFTVEAARARAFAVLGESTLVIRHVGLADDAHARVDLADLPDTHRPFATGHDAHVDNEAGKAFVALAEQGDDRATARAVERLTRAHDRFGPDREHARMRCEQRLAGLYDR